MTWNTLRTFNTRRFAVTLQYALDTDADYDGDGMAYCFRVVVSCNGRVLAEDYLGESVYYDPADFAREHYGIGARQGAIEGAIFGAYFPDMVRGAIADARKAIAGMPAMRGVA